MKKQRIYLDYAAATPTDPQVLNLMIPYFSSDFGNPESIHEMGSKSQKAIDKAKKTTAKIINCLPEEVIFCGSATESNNLAILGIARANKSRGKHLITSSIEHSSVLNAFKKLEQEGFEVTYINPAENGIIDEKTFNKAIRKDTILASIHYANNEIGTIQPIEKIGAICKKHEIIFHSDGSQAPNYLDLNMKKLNLNALTLSGSKIYGPKGVGILAVDEKIDIEPVIYGGGQELGIRSGTQNTALIVGFAEALKLATKLKAKEVTRIKELREKLLQGLLKSFAGLNVNGSLESRAPNNLNFYIPGIDGPMLAKELSAAGIYCSLGSACLGKNDPSHVISALTKDKAIAANSIRVSMGRQTTSKDIGHFLTKLKEIVKSHLA